MAELKEVIQMMYDEAGSTALLPQNMPPELFIQIGHIINRIHKRTATDADKDTFTLLVKLTLEKKEPTTQDVVNVARSFRREALRIAQKEMDTEKN